MSTLIDNKTLSELFVLVKKVNEQINDNKEFMTKMSQNVDILQQNSNSDYNQISLLRSSIERMDREILILKNLFQTIKSDHQKECKQLKEMITANITIPDFLLKEFSELLEPTQDYFNSLLINGKPSKKLLSKLDKDLATNLIIEMLRRRTQQRKYKIDLNSL